MTDTATRRRPRIALDAIPDIQRPVRLHGTLGHAEVGGGACFGIAVAIATR